MHECPLGELLRRFRIRTHSGSAGKFLNGLASVVTTRRPGWLPWHVPPRAMKGHVLEQGELIGRYAVKNREPITHPCSSSASQSANVLRPREPRRAACTASLAHDGRERRCVRRILSCATNS